MIQGARGRLIARALVRQIRERPQIFLSSPIRRTPANATCPRTLICPKEVYGRIAEFYHTGAGPLPISRNNTPFGSHCAVHPTPPRVALHLGRPVASPSPANQRWAMD